MTPEPWSKEDWEWGYRDGLTGAPWPEFLPPIAYFEGRRAGANARLAQREMKRADAA